MQTDEQVMAHVQDGNVGQLSVLFERHHRSLYKYCLAFSGKRHIAEDCVQETFRRVLQYRGSYRNGKFNLWLYRIARNVALDQLPKQFFTEPQDSADEAPGPESLAMMAQDKKALQLALMRIRPADREILMLSRFQEFGAREIGVLVGASEGAVRVRLYRALKELVAEFSTSLQQKERDNE